MNLLNDLHSLSNYLLNRFAKDLVLRIEFTEQQIKSMERAPNYAMKYDETFRFRLESYYSAKAKHNTDLKKVRQQIFYNENMAA